VIKYYPEGANTLERNADNKDLKDFALAALATTVSALNAQQQAYQIKQSAAYSGQSTSDYIIYSHQLYNVDTNTTNYWREKAKQCRKNNEICKAILACHDADPSLPLVECVKKSKVGIVQ
jgi:hypothetical protein